MATFKRTAGIPRCLNCLRRVISSDISESTSPFHQQLRGKKKSSKQPVTVNVKLLEDIRGYGRQGAIVPVAPGRMRNIWYPRQQAEYMTESRLQQLDKKDLIIERDHTFGIEQPDSGNDIQELNREGLVDVEMKLLPPQLATQIISTTLPSHLEFYRTPIVNPEPEAPRGQPPIRSFRKQAASAAAADLAAVEDSLPKSQVVAIYGSVSTADIAESIKAILAESEEGARVVLSAEDITIITEGGNVLGAEADRIKALGEFDVDIRVKGGEAVRRFISVLAQKG